MSNPIEERLSRAKTVSTTKVFTNPIEQRLEKNRIERQTQELQSKVKNYLNTGGTDFKKAAKIIYNARMSGVDNNTLTQFTYQLAKSNKEVAQKIWDYHDEDVTWGDKVATVGSSFWEGLKNAGEGIATTFGFGDESWQKPSFEQDQINKNKEQMGDLGDFLADSAYGIGNMVPSVAVSLIPGIGTAAGTATMFATSYGQSYNQAIGDGKSEDEAMTYAFLNGATSAVLEKALGVVGGSKLAQSVAGKLVKDEAVKSALGKFILRTGASAAGEFTEETLESLLQPIIYNISTSGEDQKLDGDYVLNAFRSGLIGGFTGGVFEAAGTSAKIRQGKNAAVNMPNDFSAQNVNTQNGSSVQPNVNAQSNVTQNDAQSETSRYVQEALTDELAKVNAQGKNSVSENQTPVYDRDTLSKLSDDELNKIHNEMTERYIANLPLNADTENYRKQLNETLTGRNSVISSTVTQQGELNHPVPQNQINPDIKIDFVKQLKIRDILSVDKAQLSKMSIRELKEFATKAAKVNAESMGASSEKMNNYIAQSTSGNEAALIKSIEGIQGDLEIEFNNIGLQSEGVSGRINALDENKKSNVLSNNRAQGKAFEQQEFPKFKEEKIDAVEQITIKTNQGTRIRADAIGLDPVTGKVAICEFKSSATAPLTKNQKIGFPELKKGGGIVVGKGKGKFIHGYNIPEGTDVEIIRPK